MKLFGPQVNSQVGSLLLIIICFSYLHPVVDGQFFTKSSKSIPRMGRRSAIEPAYPADRYRHLLIDTLIDEYGPNLLQALETQSRVAATNQAISGGEMAVATHRNDPKRAINEDEPVETRDERSTSGRDSSLAMRALNTNRYLQYLTSGQPLMSYARLFGGGGGGSQGSNGRDSTSGENQNKFITYDR